MDSHRVHLTYWKTLVMWCPSKIHLPNRAETITKIFVNWAPLDTILQFCTGLMPELNALFLFIYN